MKRRNFLKGLLAAPVVAPVVAEEKEVPILTRGTPVATSDEVLVSDCTCTVYFIPGDDDLFPSTE